MGRCLQSTRHRACPQQKATAPRELSGSRATSSSTNTRGHAGLGQRPRVSAGDMAPRLSCAENVYGRRDFTGTVCSLWSAEGLPRATSCHRVGHPAEPAEVRLEPGSVSHQSSRFFLLGPPALSLRHSTLFRPSVFLSQTSPGPPATPHGRISRGNNASAASGSSATVLPPHFPTGSHVTRVYRWLSFSLPGFWGPGLQPGPAPVCLLDKAQ